MPEIPAYPGYTAWANGDQLVAVDISDHTASSQGTVKNITASALTLTLQPSGDATGAADATAVSAAVSALPATGGVVRLAATGTWYIECGQVAITTSGIYIDAPGCYIVAVGAGDMIRMYDVNVLTNTVRGGGILGYPVVDGASTTGNSCALHAGDIFNLALFAQAQNFAAGTTSKGIWLDNQYFWAEQAYGRVFAGGNTAGVVFDVNSGTAATGAHVNATGSFERCNLNLYVDQGVSTYDGVVFQNGSFVVDGQLGIYGNFGTSSSPLTSAVLRITGSTPSGITDASYSSLLNSVLNIGTELDTVTGSDAPYTVFFGASQNIVTGCTGNVDFGASQPFQGSNNTGNWVGFAGVVNGDAALPVALPQGSTNIADSNQVISATSAIAIANVSAQVAAFTAYDIRVYVPHLGAGTAGTFTWGLGGPSIALASLDVKLWTGTTLTQHTQNLGTGTLGTAIAASASQRTLEVTGTIVLSSAGTLTVTGFKSAGGSSNVTVDIGASIVLTPMTAL